MTTRRQFLATSAALGCGYWLTQSPLTPALSELPSGQSLTLGLDNFAVRAMQWKAQDLIDYAARLRVDSLFVTDLDAFESLETDALRKVRDHAAEKNIALYLGTWSICPTSVTFKDKWGTAEEHLRLGIRAAHDLGSPVIRVVLGSRDDRQTPGGIRARIADTVAVIKACRGAAEEAGVKVAVENHAGDMHSSELVDLVEEAGTGFVGVNLDSGNAVWTLEDPLQNLEILGKYTLTTSLRDSVAWNSDKGVTVQWTAMGEGQVDWPSYFARFAQLCPQAPVHIETISGFNHEIPVNDEAYWKSWP
ncbi:MAG: sugar phosphate isomerase/epimerase, partial [Planctomycetales bacterium]|nr:sugar phosphate isomerase/epimerase [Planctomycetales bacterium]